MCLTGIWSGVEKNICKYVSTDTAQSERCSFSGWPQRMQSSSLWFVCCRTYTVMGSCAAWCVRRIARKWVLPTWKDIAHAKWTRASGPHTSVSHSQIVDGAHALIEFSDHYHMMAFMFLVQVEVIGKYMLPYWGNLSESIAHHYEPSTQYCLEFSTNQCYPFVSINCFG